MCLPNSLLSTCMISIQNILSHSWRKPLKGIKAQQQANKTIARHAFMILPGPNCLIWYIYPTTTSCVQFGVQDLTYRLDFCRSEALHRSKVPFIATEGNWSALIPTTTDPRLALVHCPSTSSKECTIFRQGDVQQSSLSDSWSEIWSNPGS